VQKLVNGFFHLLKIFIVFCLAAMVVLVFGNVVLRYGFNTGITVSEELSRWFFVYLTFVGAVVALHERGHLGVDTLVARLPPIGKKICLVASLVLMLACTWLFLTGSWQQTIINLDVKAPVTGLSMGIFYGVGIFFSVCTGIILLYDLYRVLTGQISDEELVMVKESEEEEAFEELQKELAEQERLEREHAAAPKH